MIIPVKCRTCGRVVGDKYQFYKRECQNIRKQKNMGNQTIYYSKSNPGVKSPEGEVLDKMGMTDSCCRQIFLTHVDII